MKISYIISILFVLLFTSTNVMALECGVGKITKLYGGGWDSDDLVLILDNSVTAPESGAGLYEGKYVRYPAASIPGRIDFVRSIALAAYMSGKNVRTVSHTSDCAHASEIVLGY
jgi:hypothetical protein